MNIKYNNLVVCENSLMTDSPQLKTTKGLMNIYITASNKTAPLPISLTPSRHGFIRSTKSERAPCG